MSADSGWTEVSKRSPCPACEHHDWCAWAPDGKTLNCQRTGTTPLGMVVITTKDGYTLYRPADESERTAAPMPKPLNFDKLNKSFIEAIKVEQVHALAEQLGVTPVSLRAQDIGWADGAALHLLGAGGQGWADRYPDAVYSFPERDGSGRIVGFTFRTEDGRKGSPSSKVGSHRGLIVSTAAATLPDPVFVVEGASDVAACTSMGLAAVGRPSNATGAEQIARMLKGRVVIVVGENDQKPDGKWPGRDGAQTVSQTLSSTWGREVPWTLPPAGQKDVRAFLNDAIAKGLKLNDEVGLAALGRQFHEGIQERAQVERVTMRVERDWPAPIAAAARIGLVGEFVDLVNDHTESDISALIGQFLIMYGNALGRTAHAKVEDSFHYLNEFVVLVGDTSKGRKGTSEGRVRAIFKLVDPSWERNCTLKGLSSGEGLIHRLRDEDLEADDDGDGGRDKATLPPPTADKRCLVVESEFASVLKQGQRQGNILSGILREAWDGNRLETVTKNSPERASDAHISMIGHVTTSELNREWSDVDMANGFGNRILWFCSRRSKLLPHGGSVPTEKQEAFAAKVHKNLEWARSQGEIVRDAEANKLWESVYEKLSSGNVGMLGAMTGRAEAHTLRISCLFALITGSNVVRVEHLRAALAICEYVERSVRYIFGDSLGDPLADEILAMLRAAPNGMTRTEIRDAFSKNLSGALLAPALQRLRAAGLASWKPEATAGRRAERWFAIVAPPPLTSPTSKSETPRPPLDSTATDPQPPVDDLRSSMSFRSSGVPEGNETAEMVDGIPETSAFTTETTEGALEDDDLRSFRSYQSEAPEYDIGLDRSDISPTTETTETTKGRTRVIELSLFDTATPYEDVG